jgi:predicted amidohydrolase
MIIGPWGAVLDECADGAGIAQAEIDMIELRRLRQTFPALEHRRELK